MSRAGSRMQLWKEGEAVTWGSMLRTSAVIWAEETEPDFCFKDVILVALGGGGKRRGRW